MSRSRLGRFIGNSDGVVTAEAVIWIPVFTFIIWLIAETSLAFGGETQALRVIQDANRMYASGYFQTAAEAESFIQTQLSSWQSTMTVSVVEVDKVIHTTITVPVTTMTGLDAISWFSNITATISSEQMSEG